MKELLSEYGLTMNDLDRCAIQYAGGDLDDPLHYICDSIGDIPKTDRKRLEEVVKQRAKQIRIFLNDNPLWEKGGMHPLQRFHKL